MRIAFVGKGGSGKTTLVSLFSLYLTSKKMPVLAIDADINQHLGESLGFLYSPPPMGIEINKIKEYLIGENKRIDSIENMIKTTPPAKGSRLIKFSERNSIYDYFQIQKNGLRMMAVGDFTEDDIGIKCYHSKTGSVELLLNHMIDKKDEYIVVDMTAGADSFASGLFTKFDITFVIVEPTLKSIKVYEQFKKYAKDYDVNLKVIANKIEDKTDLQFIKKFVEKDLVSYITQSKYVKNIEQGEKSKIANLEKENLRALEEILSEIKKQKRNWQKLYEQAVYFHKKNAISWANAQSGLDLTKQIDPNYFSYFKNIVASF